MLIFRAKEGAIRGRDITGVVGMQNIVEIEILNWEKYNPRTDRAKHSWFRLQNDIATEPKFHGLNAAQKFIAICLFAEASKGSGKAKIITPWLCDQLKVKITDVSKTIQQLVTNGVLVITSRLPADTTNTHNFQSSLTTNERTNERTNVTDGHRKNLSESVMDCITDWKQTLDHFEIKRSIGERDQLAIARAVQSFGAEWVKLAFAGARKQKAGKNWDPKQFVSLSIFLDPKRIERLVNLGSGKESADGIDWANVFGGAA